MHMTMLRKLPGNAGRLIRSERGSCTIEACFWLPFFLFFFVLIFDATYVFMRNGEVRRIVQVEKLSPGDSAKLIGERSGRFTLPVVEEVFGECVPIGLDHVPMLSKCDNDGKGARLGRFFDRNLREICGTCCDLLWS